MKSTCLEIVEKHKEAVSFIPLIHFWTKTGES